MPYTNAFESTRIGTVYANAFKRGYGHFKLYSFKTYTSAFENAGIGTTYANAFKSAGIGIFNYIHCRPISALLRMLE